MACWPWTGAKYQTTGYGQATNIQGLPGTSESDGTVAHRLAWIIAFGDPGTHVAPSGKVVANRVRHRCPGGPNRLCCNPLHLAVGTDKDNADDRHADGNTHRGEQVAVAVLTEDIVLAALHAHSVGTSIDTLAERYGVHRTTMAAALSGETWAHVAPEIKRRVRRDHPGAPPKLTADAVLKIRADKANGVTYAALAAEHGVAVGTIQAIVARRTWAHLPCENKDA